MNNYLPDIRDAHFYGGVILTSTGIGMYSVPLALVFAGLMLIYLGLK